MRMCKEKYMEHGTLLLRRGFPQIFLNYGRVENKVCLPDTLTRKLMGGALYRCQTRQSVNVSQKSKLFPLN